MCLPASVQCLLANFGLATDLLRDHPFKTSALRTGRPREHVLDGSGHEKPIWTSTDFSLFFVIFDIVNKSF